ncbi:MAG: deoxyribodipyrimidine photo-lyase, partial [Ignavibacteria bacterium]|nr:deoxyribodipyrimidine photo-lyase [Ignavibacteria bacterium]
MIKEQRIRLPQKGIEVTTGPVMYWMSRDQRAHDNWALLYAQHLAIDKKKDLIVVFSLVSEFLGATQRQYDFMLKGLMEVEIELKRHNIPFMFLLGEPSAEIPKFIKKNNAG